MKVKKSIAVMVLIVLLTSLITPVSAGISTKPAPVGLKGVTCKYKPNIKKMPAGINYSFKQISSDDAVKSPSINPAVDKLNISVDDGGTSEVDGPAYPPGTRYMVLNKNTSSFKPVVGDIFVDETKHTAIKVIDSGASDTGGSQLIPVITPQITDIYENFSIPQQSIIPNRLNIENVSPSFSLAAGAASSGSVASGSVGSGSVGSGTQGDILSIELKSPIILMEYPDNNHSGGNNNVKGLSNDCLASGAVGAQGASDSQSLSQTSQGTTGSVGGGAGGGSEAQAMGATPSADYLKEYNAEEDPANKPNAMAAADPQTAQGNSATGNSVTGQSVARLQLTKASIKVHKPVINTMVDINLIKQHILVSMDSQIDVAATIEGDIQLNKEVQLRLYDYHIKADKCDLYVQLFLIIGVDGKAHVEMNLSNSGVLSNGVEATGVMGVPIQVRPIGGFQTKSMECGMEVNSNLSVWAAGAPQIGFRVLDMDVVKMQLWAGLEGSSRFNTNGSAKNSAFLDVDYRSSLTGCLLGFPIKIFDTTIPLIHKNVSSNSPNGMVLGETANNKRTKQINYSQIKIDKVDAYKNCVEGLVLVNGKPYKSRPGSVQLTIYGSDEDGFLDTSIILSQVNTTTDTNGKFTINVPVALNNYAYIKFDETTVGSSTWGFSDYVKSESPFDDIELDADAFNDILTGSISGQYSNPDGINNSGDEILFNGPVLIKVANSADQSIKDYTVTASKGTFQKQIPIKGGDIVTATIHPFGNSTEEISMDAYPNLKALDFRIKKTAVTIDGEKKLIIDGTIFNARGSKPYSGDVQMERKDYDDLDNRTLKAKVQYDILPLKKPLTIGSTVPTQKLPKRETPGSSFEFDNIKELEITSFGFKDQHILVSIEYEGLSKVLGWGGRKAPELDVPEESLEITSPYDDLVNPITNPVDIETPMDNIIREGIEQEINIISY